VRVRPFLARAIHARTAVLGSSELGSPRRTSGLIGTTQRGAAAVVGPRTFLPVLSTTKWQGPLPPEEALLRSVRLADAASARKRSPCRPMRRHRPFRRLHKEISVRMYGQERGFLASTASQAAAPRPF
jgi:hypothetical protein